jgi:hypothetical protein
MDGHTVIVFRPEDVQIVIEGRRRRLSDLAWRARNERREFLRRLGLSQGLPSGSGPFRISNSVGELPLGFQRDRDYYIPCTTAQKRRRDIRAARRARKQRRGWA